MMGKFKNNTKIKLISLLSAIVLWLYVVAVVDPDETKLFEDIPITINNMNELKDKDLIIYPEGELTADISISGKLSKLKKIKKENIHIYGQINNPMEGKNEIYLKVNTPGQVTHELRNNIIIVNLEKSISEKKPIEIQVEGKSKINIDKLTIDKNQKSIKVSGPRSLVQQVQGVIGMLDTGSKVNDFSSQVSLMPVDKDGNEVKGVELDQSSVIVNATLLKEKNVPIKIRFAEGSNPEVNLKDYELSQGNITIKGKKEIIDKIEYIETQAVNINDITSTTSKDIYLNIPQDVIVDSKYITITLNTLNVVKGEFVYTAEEVEIRNNKNNIDISTINIPENIRVNVEYSEDIGSIKKSDITLYIDLSQGLGQDEKYDIKSDLKYEVKDIDIAINPNKTL